MNANEPPVILKEGLETFFKFLKMGDVLLKREKYLDAIQAFTEAIELGLKLKEYHVQFANMINAPSETSEILKKGYIQGLIVAYTGRAMSYYAIDEEEKGAADTAMAEKFKAEMKNPDSPKSNHIPEKKAPAPQPSYSKSSTNSGDEFSGGKVLFWMAIILLVIAALVSYFTGISFGKSVLLTFVGTIALIIWAGNR